MSVSQVRRAVQANRALERGQKDKLLSMIQTTTEPGDRVCMNRYIDEDGDTMYYLAVRISGPYVLPDTPGYVGHALAAAKLDAEIAEAFGESVTFDIRGLPVIGNDG